MVADQPLDAAVLASAVGYPTDEVHEALVGLAAEYSAQGRGFDLRNVAGGWRFYTRAEFAPVVEKFVLDGQQARLTQAALETLAVIAYRQPVGRIEIEEIRGVSAGGVLRSLQERGLIEVVGRSEALGRPLLYGTTPLFLELLGLRDLSELPKTEELTVALRPHRPIADAIDDAAAYVEAES